MDYPILLLIRIINNFPSIGKVHKIDEVILYKIAIDRLFTGIGSFERSDVKYTKIVYILYYI